MKNFCFLGVLILCAGMVFASGNNQQSGGAVKSVSGSFDTQHNWTGEIVEVHIQGVDAGGRQNEIADTAVAQALTRKTGVRIIWEQVTAEKFALQMASEDLPEVMRESGSYRQRLMSGKKLVALDQYIDQWGPNLKANKQKELDVWKAIYAGYGEAHYYAIPSNTGNMGLSAANHPLLRWKWYKELGYPEITGLDSFLQVLKQMVDKHPVTEEGKKVYGVSSFIDWGNTMPFFYPMAFPLGYFQAVGAFGWADTETSELVCQLADDPKSVYWRMTEFYYKAHQLGILDPDMYTQGWGQEAEKYNAGQLLFTQGLWDRGDQFTNQHAAELDGFVPVPWKGGTVGGNQYNYGEFCLIVTTNCRYPDAVVRLLDYTASYEGTELLYNGIQGEDWNLVNGKPMPSESVIESRKQGVDLSRTRGIGYGTANFIIGLSQFTKDPRYDSYVNFTVNPEVAAVSNSALDDDFSKHYGALSIYQVLQNFIDKGEMKDASKYRIGATKLQTAATPTNITRIETNLSQLAAAEWGPKLTFAKDDAEYRSLKAQALKAFTDAGLNEYNIWITKAWNDALDKAASYGM